LVKNYQMQVFYAPEIKNDFHVLDENESKHIIRVLRMSKGTIVKLIDGKGNLFEGVIENPDPRKCSIKITGVESNFERRNYGLHIAISPLKNQERFEWFIEKSVEIGIDEITPLISMNTEKHGIKAERLNNIIISAMKQSLKATRTVLHEPCSFNDFIAKKSNVVKMIAHCNGSFPGRKIPEIYTAGEDAIILIGPEGDFKTEEIVKAETSGYKSISLGKSRLRTETAGIAACHAIYFLNQ
jgi:16S rRNA (uracil1498-N3)-methyltransferase